MDRAAPVLVRKRRRPGATQVLVQGVDRVLVASVRVDRHHVAPLDAECVMDNLYHRSQAICRTRRVGDHGHVASDRPFVYAVNDGRICAGSRRRDQHLARAGSDELSGSILLSEVSGAFHGDIDSMEWHLGRVSLG